MFKYFIIFATSKKENNNNIILEDNFSKASVSKTQQLKNYEEMLCDMNFLTQANDLLNNKLIDANKNQIENLFKKSFIISEEFAHDLYIGDFDINTLSNNKDLNTCILRNILTYIENNKIITIKIDIMLQNKILQYIIKEKNNKYTIYISYKNVKTQTYQKFINNFSFKTGEKNKLEKFIYDQITCVFDSFYLNSKIYNFIVENIEYINKNQLLTKNKFKIATTGEQQLNLQKTIDESLEQEQQYKKYLETYVLNSEKQNLNQENIALTIFQDIDTQQILNQNSFYIPKSYIYDCLYKNTDQSINSFCFDRFINAKDKILNPNVFHEIKFNNIDMKILEIFEIELYPHKKQIRCCVTLKNDKHEKNQDKKETDNENIKRNIDSNISPQKKEANDNLSENLNDNQQQNTDQKTDYFCVTFFKNSIEIFDKDDRHLFNSKNDNIDLLNITKKGIIKSILPTHCNIDSLLNLLDLAEKYQSSFQKYLKNQQNILLQDFENYQQQKKEQEKQKEIEKQEIERKKEQERKQRYQEEQERKQRYQEEQERKQRYQEEQERKQRYQEEQNRREPEEREIPKHKNQEAQNRREPERQQKPIKTSQIIEIKEQIIEKPIFQTLNEEKPKKQKKKAKEKENKPIKQQPNKINQNQNDNNISNNKWNIKKISIVSITVVGLGGLTINIFIRNNVPKTKHIENIQINNIQMENI